MKLLDDRPNRAYADRQTNKPIETQMDQQWDRPLSKRTGMWLVCGLVGAFVALVVYVAIYS